MAHNNITPPAPPSAERIREGHEPLEVNVGRVYAMTGITFLFLIVASLSLFAVWHAAMHIGEPVKTDDRRPTAQAAGPWAPLNPDQPAELKDLRARENDELMHVGWINREAGVVRIPIAKAMQMLVEQGLPPTPPVTTPETSR